MDILNTQYLVVYIWQCLDALNSEPVSLNLNVKKKNTAKIRVQQHPLQSQNVKMLANHSKYSGFYSHVTTSSTCLPSWMSLGHKFWTLSLTVCHLQVLDRSWWRHLWNRLLKPPNYPPPKRKSPPCDCFDCYQIPVVAWSLHQAATYLQTLTN